MVTGCRGLHKGTAMPKIERNRHPAGRLSNLGFGLIQIADGLVRTISLGYLHTDLGCWYTRRQSKAMFAKLAKQPTK